MMEGSFAEVAPFPLLIEIKNIDGAVTFAADNTLTQQIELLLSEQTIEEAQMAIRGDDINNSCDDDDEDKMGMIESNNEDDQLQHETEAVTIIVKDDTKLEEMRVDYNCAECSENFESKEIYDIHMSGHKNNMKCAICNMVLKSLKNYEKHCLRCKPYECQICGRVVRFRPNFIKHMRVHSGQQAERHKYKCEVCKKEFMSFEYFKVHKKIHNANVNLTCDVCGKVFSALASLRGHTKLHTGMKLHKCEVCGKGFGQRYNLKLHSRVHTNEAKMIECVLCKKKFTSNVNYRTHLQTHQEVIEKKPKTKSSGVQTRSSTNTVVQIKLESNDDIKTVDENIPSVSTSSTASPSLSQTSAKSISNQTLTPTSISSSNANANANANPITITNSPPTPTSSISSISASATIISTSNTDKPEISLNASSDNNSSTSDSNVCNDVSQDCSDISGTEASKYIQKFDPDLIDTNDLSNSFSYPNLFENDSISEGICLENDEKAFSFVSSALDLNTSTTDGNFIRKEWVFGNYAVGEKLEDDIFSETTSFIYD